MKLINYIVVFVFCSSIVSAETTLELLQQRAEAGDATAQTLMGFMTYYGYQTPRDIKASEGWYERAVDQGDPVAKKIIDMIKNSSEAAYIADRVHLNQVLYYLPDEELKIIIDESSVLDERVRVTMEMLTLNRKSYIGKIVEIEFNAGQVNVSPGMNPYLTAYGKSYEGGAANLILQGPLALKWAMCEARKGYGSVSKVLALVHKNGLIGLGVARCKEGDRFIYTW